MGRVFAYTRVSRQDLVADNQRREIEAAGFEIDARRYITEVISGSVPAFLATLDTNGNVLHAELCEDLDDLEATNTPLKAIDSAIMWVAVARENLPQPDISCAPDSSLSLFFITHEVEGENYNAFVAAADGGRASMVWAEWMQKQWGCDDMEVLHPQRLFLFSASQVIGPERVIPWHSDELRQVAGTLD